MAGLIQQQMAPGQPEQPMPEEPMPQEGMAPEGDDDSINEDDPGFKEALAIVMRGLYEAGAAEDLAQALQSEDDIATAMADNGYKMVSIATDSVDIDPETLPLLAIVTLQEIAEIAEAAGIKATPNDVAEAFRMMLLQALEESGADITELEQATAEVDPEMFMRAAAAEDDAPAAEAPPPGDEDAAEDQGIEDDKDEEIPA